MDTLVNLFKSVFSSNTTAAASVAPAPTPSTNHKALYAYIDTVAYSNWKIANNTSYEDYAGFLSTVGTPSMLSESQIDPSVLQGVVPPQWVKVEPGWNVRYVFSSKSASV